MRRETDFILEQAPWPALLLDETGQVCRANRAALFMVGKDLQVPLAPFELFWDSQNKIPFSQFIAQPEGGTCQAKIQLAAGLKGDFFVHLVRLNREEQVYLLLQLFKDSGGHFPDLAALIPPVPQQKPEAQPVKTVVPPATPAPVLRTTAPEPPVFALEHASWPVLLVQKGGMIQKANAAAVRMFGSSVNKTDTPFASLWMPENTSTAAEFLKMANGSGLPIKLRLKTGVPYPFQAFASADGNPDLLLIQLFPASMPSEPAQSPAQVSPEPSPTPVAAEAAAAASSPAGEVTIAYKQKLDCAMQLARSISLDLNNALTSILGHTSLVLSKADTNNAWRPSLVEIEKSASRAAEIANDLAVFSRQDKEPRNQTGGNLNSLLERAIEGIKADHGSIEWSTHFERKLFTATVDEAKIQQAFLKVLENSAQAIVKNGRVNVQTRNLEVTEAMQDGTVRLAPGSYVCVEVTDNGQGIAPDVLPRIFEPFFTTKGKNHRGLGLAWVYGIVTNHGGGVAVSSNAGSGTSARIYLPANKKLIKEALVGTESLHGNQTILFVDDEDLLLTMGQMVLSSFGYTVYTANSGQKALEILSQAKQPINLMITDLVMPSMSGRELTEHVQRLSPQTHILWSSGYVVNDNTAKQRTYLQKPFSSQDLLRKVKEVLSE